MKAYLRYIFTLGFLKCELVVVLTLSDYYTAIMFFIKRNFLKFTDFISEVLKSVTNDNFIVLHSSGREYG